MSQEIKNVALMGAGGNLGPTILKALFEAKYNVTVISRASSDATFPGSTVIKTDYSESSLVDAFQGIDAVVSTLSGTGFLAQKTTIDAAVKAGVKRFIPSEFGGDTTNPRARDMAGLIYQPKNEVAEYLKAKVAENPSFSYTLAISGPFFDWGLRLGFLPFDIKKKTALIFDDGETKFSTSTLAQIGRAVAAILAHPAETENKDIFFDSFTVSQNEILAVFEKVTGSKWTLNHTTAAAVLQQGKEALSKGDMGTGVFQSLVGVTFTQEDTGGNFPQEHTLSNDLLGLPHEDLEEAINAYIESSKA
ncbi:MAG: hypothetical protein M1833_004915 [Piccolia ochrophora]|nr:MAG: hypothetical protein M1833_004915 [Piccolia ochrophora]